MKFLKETILSQGNVLSDTILKVDSFLNHQIDPVLMMEIGKEFKQRFENKKINKILTIEASGIAIGLAVAHALGVPLVFAKKKKPSTMESMLSTKVHSFTKNIDYDICISREFLNKNDQVLIVDDFLAMGNAAEGLCTLCEEAGADISGIGIVIEKGFQSGRNILEKRGIQVESLAILDRMTEGEIKFK